MKVTLITTVNHNVGDDFVRDGITHLLRQAIGPFELALIHKHFPLTVRPEWEWLHLRGITKAMDCMPGMRALGWSRLIDRLPLRPTSDKILTTDLLVQSGAPVYWLNDSSDSLHNEWYEPLVTRRWEQAPARVPLLNLGAGACQAYHSDGSEFLGAPAILAFVRKFHAQCTLTTVRDQLSKSILAHAGVDATLLPCPSLFARRLHGMQEGEAAYIALNYMKAGGHFRLGASIDDGAWRDTFVTFARELALSERCLMVCHSLQEKEEATRLLPELEIFYSADHRDYLRVYSRAKCGVVNRVHAAFALANFGRPSLVIGSDSRARMAGVIGLPCMYVGETSVEKLQAELKSLLASLSSEARRLEKIGDEAEAAYVSLLRSALDSWVRPIAAKQHDHEG